MDPIQPQVIVDLRGIAFDTAPGPCLVVDAAGRIAAANRAAERLLGYDRDELLGVTLERLLSERSRAALPALQAASGAASDASALGAGREVQVVRKDGVQVAVALALALNPPNPIDAAGEPVTVVSLVDLSARPETAARFEAAIESAPAGMVMADPLGRIVLVNRELERLFGYTRAELLGQPVELLVPVDLRGGHHRQREGYQAAPATRRMGAGRELYGRRKDGSLIGVEIGLNAIAFDDGTYVLGAVVDLTERRKLEARVRQAEKMEALGAMAGGIAHDFNNILLAVIGYSEIVRDLAPPGTAMREDLERVIEAGTHGRDLVQRILSFSRREQGTTAPTALAKVVRDALELAKMTLPAAVELRTHLDPATPLVRCDPSQITQVVMNLVVNSGHAMAARGGILAVSLVPFDADPEFVAAHPGTHVGLHARLTVTDTGVGMPEEVVARVFEPFFTTRAAGEGTGLGLSVVHEIVRGYEGDVALESRLGVGTTVDVVLPAAELVAGTPSAWPEDDPVPGDARPRILLVEDEDVLRQLQERQLSTLGYRVFPFGSSLEALAAFRSRPEAFDLLITDNNMPRLSGLMLAAELVRIRPGMKVLMVSGLADTLDADVLRERGVGWVLCKPHTREQLAQAVREALDAP